MSTIRFITALLVLLPRTAVSQDDDTVDPCKTTRMLPNIDKRITNYVIDSSSGEQPLCDRFLIHSDGQWFTTGQHNMVSNRTVIGLNKCGTQSPIWMEGDVPTEEEGLVERKACVTGFFSLCDEELKIKVRNCKNKMVYFLQRPSGCPEAYCFGVGDEGVSAPNVSILITSVKVTLKNITTDTSILQRYVVKCLFSPLPDPIDSPFYYQVHWQFNEETHVSNSYRSNSIEQTDIHEEDGIFIPGKIIACRVRIKLSEKGPPGPFSKINPVFYAGLQLDRTAVQIKSGETTETVHISSTIPIGCLFLKSSPAVAEPCDFLLEASIPFVENQCETTVSTAQVKDKHDNINYCGTKLNVHKWNVAVPFNLTIADTNQYEITSPVQYVTLKPNSKYHPIWNAVQLSPIKVSISRDETWKSKICYAHSDPHMKTFDGYLYENQNPGTYTLYRLEDSQGRVQEVQIELTSCNRGTATCVCGIAVRAGLDVFVIDKCRSQGKIYYKSCVDNLIDARKSNDFNYKIYLPTGTYVSTKLWTYSSVNVMEVDVAPTARDKDHSRGLCGKLDGKPGGDFIDRDGIKRADHRYPEIFTASWRVKDSVSLLKMTEDEILNIGSWDNEFSYCVCEADKNTQMQAVNCAPSEALRCKRSEKPVQKRNCVIRKKRHFRQKFTFQPDNIIITKPRLKRDVTAAVYMTDAEARDYCEAFMLKSPGYVKCKDEIPSLDATGAIETCILDISLTNSTAWAAASREGLLSACFKELEQDNSLSNSTDGGPSIAEQIREIACPNDCSGNGNCTNGTCVCFEDYISSDCSVDKNDPPLVYGANTDEGGLCNVQDCDSAYLIGDSFIDVETLMCKLEKFSISYNGTITMMGTNYVHGDHNTLVDISCPFPSTNDSAQRLTVAPTQFVYGYNISVSNNALDYSTVHPLYILDSTCQDTVNVSGSLKFILKEGYCFIRGYCFSDNQINTLNHCEICNSKNDKFGWSDIVSKECSVNIIINKGSDSKLWIIGVVMGVLVLVLAAVFIAKKSMNHKIQSGISSPKPCHEDHGNHKL